MFNDGTGNPNDRFQPIGVPFSTEGRIDLLIIYPILIVLPLLATGLYFYKKRKLTPVSKLDSESSL